MVSAVQSDQTAIGRARRGAWRPLAVLEVNCDDSPKIASEYGVMSMPTVIVFHNGEPVEKLVGLRPKSVYESLLTKYA